MKYLADENVPLSAIERLRTEGIDVTSAAELLAGKADARVLEEANRESRVVITFDKDFAELVSVPVTLPPVSFFSAFGQDQPRTSRPSSRASSRATASGRATSQ